MATTDIWISEINGSRRIRIPWLPDTVKLESNGALFAEYDIMDKGEVKVPNGTYLRGADFSSVLPGEGHKDLPFLRGTWKKPETYVKVWETWRSKGEPLRLLVTNTPINLDVYLTDYTAEYGGGYGDCSYTLKFIEKKDLSISSNKVKLTRPSKKEYTYTVVKGDCLWTIAQKLTGSGSNWKQIYNDNKNVIETTAKDRGMTSSSNGHWIFPGTKLRITR